MSEKISGKERAHEPKAARTKQGKKKDGGSAVCGIARYLNSPAASKRQGLAFDPPEVIGMGG